MKVQKPYNLFVEPLSNEEFNKHFDTIIETVIEKVKVKAAEYVRNDDRMHNFNRASIKRNIIRERSLDGMRLKHEVSIEDMLNDIDSGLLPKLETVMEKFGDRLIYDILEQISIMHRINHENTEASDRS